MVTGKANETENKNILRILNTLNQKKNLIASNKIKNKASLV